MVTKRALKAALSLSPVNAALVRVARALPMTPTLARLPVALSEVEGRVGGTRFTMLDPGRCTIAKELFWGRGERVKESERCAVQLFFDLARSADRVLDIGANTGLFSLVAARANPRCSVDAFEIVPDVFELLVRNIFRNDAALQISPRFRGIGRAGQVMRVPSFRDASSLPTSVSGRDENVSGVRVQFDSLDRVVGETPGPILIKVDVEGTEDELLSEGLTTLREARVFLVCEFLSTANMAIIHPLLDGLKLQAYLIRDGYLEKRESVEARADYHDWLLTRETLDGRTSIPIR